MSEDAAPTPRAELLDRILRGSLANVGLRAATLALRFVIGFYVISYLGLEAAGIYGLGVGAVGLMPAVVGWGLNYFLAREVVGMSPDAAAPHVRDRLRITVGSLTLVSALLVGVWTATGQPVTTTHWLILALLWLETLALDIYMPLIGLELVWQANLVVFVRSALWVPIVVALGVSDPAFRDVNTVFGAWIVGHLLSLAVLFYLLRHWPVLDGLRANVYRPTLAARLRRSWYIYISDIGLVGLAYLDRFIVNFVLGLAATGIYSFYWSITFALQTLVTTAVVQPALPRLLRAFRTDAATFTADLRAEMTKVGFYSAGLAVGIAATVGIIFRVAPGRFPEDFPLLAMLLLAAAARSAGEMLNIAIAATGRDHAYATTNVVGIVVTVALSWFLLTVIGLIGAAIAAFATALILCAIRLLWVRRIVRETPAAPAVN